jgi:hypothetical protein
MNERQDELSTADLAGQRARDVELDDDRMDRMDRKDHMDRMDEDDFGAHGRAAADDRPAAERVADERADALADDRAARIAPDVDPGLDRPADGREGRDGRDGNGQATVPLTTTGTAPAAATSGAGTQPLLTSSDAEGFRARWTDVQTGFVDAPRQAVESADGLVAELMQHLAKTFADERSGLERQWDRGDDVSTDDLRSAFQRYRSFFERLLST